MWSFFHHNHQNCYHQYHNYHFKCRYQHWYFIPSYAQNVVFDVQKKMTKLPELGGVGGLANSGNARKKTCFSLWCLPLGYVQIGEEWILTYLEWTLSKLELWPVIENCTHWSWNLFAVSSGRGVYIGSSRGKYILSAFWYKSSVVTNHLSVGFLLTHNNFKKDSLWIVSDGKKESELYKNGQHVFSSVHGLVVEDKQEFVGRKGNLGETSNSAKSLLSSNQFLFVP